jgi:hypothetical protein
MVIDSRAAVSRARPPTIWLTFIKNLEATAAYDVTVAVDPAPVRSKESGEAVIIPKVVRTLVPGQEWRTF